MDKKVLSVSDLTQVALLTHGESKRLFAGKQAVENIKTILCKAVINYKDEQREKDKQLGYKR